MGPGRCVGCAPGGLPRWRQAPRYRIDVLVLWYPRRVSHAAWCTSSSPEAIRRSVTHRPGAVTPQCQDADLRVQQHQEPARVQHDALHAIGHGQGSEHAPRSELRSSRQSARESPEHQPSVTGGGGPFGGSCVRTAAAWRTEVPGAGDQASALRGRAEYVLRVNARGGSGSSHKSLAVSWTSRPKMRSVKSACPVPSLQLKR